MSRTKCSRYSAWVIKNARKTDLAFNPFFLPTTLSNFTANSTAPSKTQIERTWKSWISLNTLTCTSSLKDAWNPRFGTWNKSAKRNKRKCYGVNHPNILKPFLMQMFPNADSLHQSSVWITKWFVGVMPKMRKWENWAFKVSVVNFLWPWKVSNMLDWGMVGVHLCTVTYLACLKVTSLGSFGKRLYEVPWFSSWYLVTDNGVIYFVSSIMRHRGPILTFRIMNTLLFDPSIVKTSIRRRTQGNTLI